MSSFLHTWYGYRTERLLMAQYRYHDENTREEDLTHPEDIAHFKKHDQMDDEQYNQQRMDKMSIVEQNIPPMFRRQ